MTYILGMVVIGLFFLALNYFTDLDHAQKWWLVTIILSILSVVVMFNEYNKSNNQKILDTAMKFHQNRTIVCNGLEINTTYYTLSTGTYTFIGKEDTFNYGKMISVSECE